MDADEKQKMKDRIATAEDIERRIAYLTKAIKDVRPLNAGAGVHSLVIPFSPGARISYFQNTTDFSECRHTKQVCWSDSEDGLIEEITEAIIGALEGRLEQAKKELAEV